MRENIYRHRCRQADASYHDGFAMVFFDIWAMEWTLVHAKREVWVAWSRDRTQPHPLRWECGADYWVSVNISCCPWSGMMLAEDPNFLAAERRVNEMLLELPFFTADGGER